MTTMIEHPESGNREAHRLWPAPDAGLPPELVPADCHREAPVHWQAGPEPDLWTASLALGDLEAGLLCVPSMILVDDEVRAQAMELRWKAGGALPLSPIRIDPDADPLGEPGTLDTRTTPGGSVTGGYDCFETRTPVSAAELHLQLTTRDGAPPRVGLLLGVRPRRLLVEDDGATAPELEAPCLSQMCLDVAIARHVCSPLSVAMVLGRMGIATDPEAFARSTEHPDHRRLFGMWPLNLARAWRAGAAGMIRVFTRPAEVAALLAAGHPVVASIRFEEGALPGAPLPRTGGHLVVLLGMDADGVRVNDPAAPNDASVRRRYARKAFLEAWLADRGVGYVLWQRSATAEGP